MLNLNEWMGIVSAGLVLFGMWLYLRTVCKNEVKNEEESSNSSTRSSRPRRDQ